MPTSDHALLAPFRHRSVRVGLLATLVVLSALALYPLLDPAPGVNWPAFWAMWGGGLAGGIIVAFLPWREMLRTGVGQTAMYLWVGLDIVLITGVLVATGGEGRGIEVLYFLTTVFFAVVYPPRGQFVLLVFTVAMYILALGLTGWPVGPGAITVRVVALAVAAYITRYLSRELRTQVVESQGAREEAERRAHLLASVAGAARAMSSLDLDQVLSAVVDATAKLGFEAVEVARFDAEHATYDVVFPHGLPDDYVAGAPYPAGRGVAGLVLERGETVVVDDYSAFDDALPAMRNFGYRSVIATPIWAQGRLAAALIAGTHEHRRLSGEDREAFELLAAQAGRALENAHRFEDERRTVEQLAELDRLKRDFLSNVSHELRTPITVIGGLSDTLLRRWEDLGEDGRRLLVDRIGANAGSLDDIIGTLLDFSRLEVGTLEMRPQPVDLDDTLERLVTRLSSLFEAHHTLRPDLGSGATVHADPVLLDRVVENLLNNARTHTPPGTTVHLTTDRADEAVLVTVADDGPGIPEEELRHLGDRFFRGGDPNTRPTRGLGLGLALASEILAMHGSALEVASAPGEGTTFRFRLPLASVGSATHT